VGVVEGEAVLDSTNSNHFRKTPSIIQYDKKYPTEPRFLVVSVASGGGGAELLSLVRCPQPI
jgi:hypothetical protein